MRSPAMHVCYMLTLILFELGYSAGEAPITTCPPSRSWLKPQDQKTPNHRQFAPDRAFLPIPSPAHFLHSHIRCPYHDRSKWVSARIRNVARFRDIIRTGTPTPCLASQLLKSREISSSGFIDDIFGWLRNESIPHRQVLVLTPFSSLHVYFSIQQLYSKIRFFRFNKFLSSLLSLCSSSHEPCPLTSRAACVSA